MVVSLWVAPTFEHTSWRNEDGVFGACAGLSIHSWPGTERVRRGGRVGFCNPLQGCTPNWFKTSHEGPSLKGLITSQSASLGDKPYYEAFCLCFGVGIGSIFAPSKSLSYFKHPSGQVDPIVDTMPFFLVLAPCPQLL